VQPPLLHAFLFPSTLWEVMLHPLSQASVFIYSSHGKWAFPLSCGVFLPPSLLQAFPLLVAGRVLPPLLLSLTSLFIYCSMGDCPSPPTLRVPCHLCYVSFLFLLLIIQFFFLFSLGGGRSDQGGYADLTQGCLWEYCMPLSSPCGLCLPQWSGHWRLAAWEPSWFLRLMQSGNTMHGVGVWRSQSFPSSRWFFL
jgi:hypothetical protein